MKAATRKYLVFVDPDDFVEPNVYGKLVQQMEREQLDMLRLNFQVVDEKYNYLEKNGLELSFDYSPRQMTGLEFIATRLYIACNIWRYIYRREIITENNIWCFTGDYYDVTPWLPLVLLKAERMNVCDTIAYNYLERSDSLVKARDQKMMKRKSDGIILLLKYLEQELADVQANRLAIGIWKKGVVTWYKRMETHSVVSLLANIATSLFDERNNYILELNNLNIFPLSTEKCTKKNIT